MSPNASDPCQSRSRRIVALGTFPARAGFVPGAGPAAGRAVHPWLVEDAMFTLPLSDDNPTRRTPVVTYAVIAACVGMFLWQVSLGPRAGQAIVYSLGLIPAVLFGSAQLPPELRLVPAPASVVTSPCGVIRRIAWLPVSAT